MHYIHSFYTSIDNKNSKMLFYLCKMLNLGYSAQQREQQPNITAEQGGE